MSDQTPPPRKRVVRRVVRKPVTTPGAGTPAVDSPPVTTATDTPATGGSATSRTRTRPRQARVPAAPDLPQPAAAALVGVLVGLLVTLLTGLGLLLFSAVRGTSTGNGWGLLLFVAIMIVAVFVGQRLLRYVRVPEPVATSMVGVLLAITLVLAFFVGLVDDWWAWLVVPAIGAACYAVTNVIISSLVPVDE